MNRKERLMRTFAGKSVDRPAVCFYEINGFTQNPSDPDLFNIFNDPSWQPLLTLTREKSDVIANTYAPVLADGKTVSIVSDRYIDSRDSEVGNRRITQTEICCKNRILKYETVTEKDINTTWVTEHLLKDTDDLKAWLELPLPEFCG